MKTTTKTKGFGIAKKLTHFQTFSCECLWHNKDTDEEELVELWSIKIDHKYDSETRKGIALGLIYCFLETDEAIKRGINRIFLWNNKSRAYEPLGIVSDSPMPDSEPIETDGDPNKGYQNLLKLCEVEVLRMEG